jgi:hypothetical protein
MGVVAAAAGHINALLKARREAEPGDLVVAVDADLVLRVVWFWFDVLAERLSRPVGEREPTLDARPRVALGADFDRPLLREFAGVGNIVCRDAFGMGQLIFCVFGTGAVAAFARDAQHELLLVIDVAFVGVGFKVGGVTFQTARADGPIEDGLPIEIAGAVDPLAAVGPVRNGELVESIRLPVKIGLAYLARAGDDIHALTVFA